jgi:hypothetical protein
MSRISGSVDLGKSSSWNITNGSPEHFSDAKVCPGCSIGSGVVIAGSFRKESRCLAGPVVPLPEFGMLCIVGSIRLRTRLKQPSGEYSISFMKPPGRRYIVITGGTWNRNQDDKQED